MDVAEKVDLSMVVVIQYVASPMKYLDCVSMQVSNSYTLSLFIYIHNFTYMYMQIYVDMHESQKENPTNHSDTAVLISSGSLIDIESICFSVSFT